MIAVYLLLATFLLILFVHLSYVYVMGYKYAEKHGGVPRIALVFFIPTIVVMVPFYVLMNWTIGNILFLELRFNLEFTKRCDRHLAGEDNWRKKQALFWCSQFLDPFDPDGVHCKHKRR